MIGFLKKDFFVLRKQLLTYAAILLIYAVVSVSGVWGPYVISAVVSLVTLMCPLSALSYDQMSRWDLYARSLPNGGRNAVLGRYVFTLLVCAASTAACILCSGALAALGALAVSPLELVVNNLATGVVGLLMAAATLPLCYKFGTERGRVLMMVVFVVVFAALIGALALVDPSDGGGGSGGAPEMWLVAGIAALLVVLAVGLFYGSYRLSRKIYLAKDL